MLCFFCLFTHSHILAMSKLFMGVPFWIFQWQQNLVSLQILRQGTSIQLQRWWLCYLYLHQSHWFYSNECKNQHILSVWNLRIHLFLQLSPLFNVLKLCTSVCLLEGLMYKPRLSSHIRSTDFQDKVRRSESIFSSSVTVHIDLCVGVLCWWCAPSSGSRRDEI